MSDARANPVGALDLDLGLMMFALGALLALAVVSRQRVGDVRREVRSARAAREDAQEEAARLRDQLDGTLEELHRVAEDRDELRTELDRATAPEQP
jgi:chromosome segregation ATPase